MTISYPQELIQKLQHTNHTAVLTGAGVSAESSVPTFREAQTGLWEKYRPEELASPKAFRANPQRVWEWYQWRRDLISNVKPNPGHFALGEMETYLNTRGAQFTLITQNVDGFHRQAGNQNVIELHGNIFHTKCLDCDTSVQSWESTDNPPPRCPECNGLLRPDVVWFGENLPQEALHTAIESARQCDLFFSIGTSAVVQPAASLPILAQEAGAKIIEINPNKTPLTKRVDYYLQGPSGEILPQLLKLMSVDHNSGSP